MGGNYSHTSRATGTVLTPTIYNGDHNNHVTNEIPSAYDDYSVDNAQMEIHTNPGTVGAESLATSMAGELERLRFILRLLKLNGNTSRHWYQPDSLPGDPIFRQVFSD